MVNRRQIISHLLPMKVLPAITALFLSTLSLLADPVRISGRGDANYTNPIGKPGKEVEAAARKEAIYNAVDRALEGQSDALREQFKKFGKTMTAEEYEAKGIVTESRKATAIPDPKARKVTVLFEGTLDIQALRDKMNATSSTEGGTDVKLSKVAAMVFFTVRETTENFIHGDKIVTGAKRLDTVEAEKNVAVSGSDESLSAKGNAARLRETKTSVEVGVAKRTDKQKFALDGPSRDAFGAGLKEIFTAKGFKKIKDGTMLEVSKEVDEAYGSGEGLPAAVKKKMVKEVVENMPKVRYMVVGTVDFSMPTLDKVTGQHQYVGRITGDVWEMDEDGGLPDVVAALAPTQVTMSADTQQDAKARVIRKISQEAANDIITKLRNKEGI
jgi:hypothetical protein